MLGRLKPIKLRRIVTHSTVASQRVCISRLEEQSRTELVGAYQYVGLIRSRIFRGCDLWPINNTSDSGGRCTVNRERECIVREFCVGRSCAPHQRWPERREECMCVMPAAAAQCGGHDKLVWVQNSSTPGIRATPPIETMHHWNDRPADDQIETVVVLGFAFWGQWRPTGPKNANPIITTVSIWSPAGLSFQWCSF